MKRLGIFVFYDRDGIVDTYVEYLLTALMEHLERLVIVCNGRLEERGRKKLERFADDIFVRENTGYDAMAYRLALTDYLGWKAVEKYDEILLLNDTFYGPLYPLSEVFFRMDEKKCSFWGLTCKQEGRDNYSREKIPAYIQSYFMAFRREIFLSDAFQNYWNDFDSTGWFFSDVLNRHEKVFTHTMEQAGFSWDTYIQAKEYESKEPENNFVQYFYIAYQLIKDYRCPVIKKKCFAKKRLTENPGELGNDTAKAFSWIKENTDYDVDLIWENLLRLYKMMDIQKSLNLNYVIPENNVALERGGRTNAAVFLYGNEPLTSQQEQYVGLLKEYMEVLDISLADRRISSEYILLLFNIGMGQNGRTALRKYSAVEEQWGNLVGNRAYAESIFHLFSEHTRMGVLMAPCGIHGADFGGTEEWKLMGCTALWCRREVFIKMTDVLRELVEQSSLKSAMELRSEFMETAQQMGYYSAVGMRLSYVSMAYTNMTEMLWQIEQHTQCKYLFDNFESYLDGDMLLFCEKYPTVYVYGAGENGFRAANLIVSGGYFFSGFIVSDNQPEIKEKYGYPVYRLSELSETVFCAGIVISVADKRAQAEIREQLRNKGLGNIFLL